MCDNLESHKTELLDVRVDKPSHLQFSLKFGHNPLICSKQDKRTHKPEKPTIGYA